MLKFERSCFSDFIPPVNLNFPFTLLAMFYWLEFTYSGTIIKLCIHLGGCSCAKLVAFIHRLDLIWAQTLSSNAVHVSLKGLCTVQPLGRDSWESNMAYFSSLRDFPVFINLVRGSMLASVRWFQLRLNIEQDMNMITDQLLKYITVLHIYNKHACKNVLCNIIGIAFCGKQLFQTCFWRWTTYMFHIHLCTRAWNMQIQVL